LPLDPPAVLVVDDDPDILEATTLLLESEGYRVETARDGREALDKLAGGATPAVILLDLMMPGMNGFDFYGRLRQLPGPQANLPVIVVSATREAQRHARDLGANGCLPKPYELQDLLDEIAALLPPARG
jgi:two-component system, chemotaxis family, chemotaxis protein CheY